MDGRQLQRVMMGIVVLVSSSTACCFPALYNFGDSNSDTGSSSAAFGRIPYPNGKTFFGKPSGRLSDGRLIIDFIAEKIGLRFLNGFLDSIQSNFQYGANFAVSGSTIQQANGRLYDAGFNPLSLHIQLSQFQQLKDRTNEFYYQAKSSEIKSTLPRPEDFAKSLYTFDIGQNDLNFGLISMSEEKVKTFIPDLINHFALAIEKLYQGGARKFWVHNTGPIGCLPLLVTHYPPNPGNADQNGCIQSYNDVAQEFNKQLKDELSQLRTKLLDAVVVYVDIYSAKYTLISEAKTYGFVSPLMYCFGHSRTRETSVVNRTEGSTTTSPSCDDPSKYISWDSVHYTEAANYWVANHIINGSFSDPPVPLTQACQGPRLSSI